MANVKVVNADLLDADLLAVANAIRGKTGTSEQIQWPDGYVTAIGEIKTEDHANEDALLSGTLSGHYRNERVTSLRTFIFGYDKNLVIADFPKVETIGGSAFNNAAALEEGYFPCLEKFASTASFSGCTSLKMLDIGNVATVYASTFNNCKVLNILILRRNSLSSLGNLNAFTGTPFAQGGVGGKIYVPSALIETYKTATNWSVLYGYGTCEFVALEGSEYE